MCDADACTFGLDMDHLARLCAEHDPAAVIPVHVLGVPAEMDALMRLKARHEFLLMEDCCAATGSRHAGRPVGTFGELSSFSFYFGHHLSTIEGGMVCTSDEALADILLQIRSHGWPKDLAPDKEARQARAHGVIEFNRRFTFYYPGFNVRSTDLNARLGLTQLGKADAVVARRVENHRAYQARFAEARGFTCQSNSRATISSISFVALAASLEHRERVGRALDAHRIETRPLGGGNMSRQPFWTDRYGVVELAFADRVHVTSFQIPNHPLLTPGDINDICDVVLAVSPD
jgi:CDP-6-deoxy-D-xylo-4-hexulose-3-dehydrase